MRKYSKPWQHTDSPNINLHMTSTLTKIDIKVSSSVRPCNFQKKIFFNKTIRLFSYLYMNMIFAKWSTPKRTENRWRFWIDRTYIVITCRNYKVIFFLKIDWNFNSVISLHCTFTNFFRLLFYTTLTLLPLLCTATNTTILLSPYIIWIQCLPLRIHILFQFQFQLVTVALLCIIQYPNNNLRLRTFWVMCFSVY